MPRPSPSVLVPVTVEHPSVQLPDLATDGSGCVDLRAYIPEGIPGGVVVVSKDAPAVISTGLRMAIPRGWVLEVYSRSGHGFSKDVRLANCVGIIDSDYRGVIMVKLTADQQDGFLEVRNGDRIAQAKLVESPRIIFSKVDSLPGTTRGDGGLGSTGHS